MKMHCADAQVLSLDSGVVTCTTTAEQIPALIVTVRILGQKGPVNLAIRNPKRLIEDLPVVMAQSSVLNGGEFVPERLEGEGQ